MSARILALDSEEHRKAQELLPWLVNGTLDAGEAAQVRAHLARCSVCQEEAAALEQLRHVPLENPTREHVDRGWAALRRTLDRGQNAPERGAPARAWWRDGWTVAVAVQAAVIVVLAVALSRAWSPAETYRALGAAPAADANAIAIFRADATQAQMSAALRAAQARIVGGPVASDAYLLRLPDAGPAALERLRTQAGVLEVQSLQAPPMR